MAGNRSQQPDELMANSIRAAEKARSEADERDKIMNDLAALLARAERIGCVRLVHEETDRKLRAILAQ